MSLAIDIERVAAVLLADGWHRVKDNSFVLDAYEFMRGHHAVVSNGQVQGVPPTGASWMEQAGNIIYCPLTAIRAVRIDKRKPVGRLRSIGPPRGERPR
jgi:hypothetical protein